MSDFKLVALESEYSGLKARIIESIREGIKEDFAALFTKYPELRWFQWTQYAPYFNDGDPCNFHVHEIAYGTGTPHETSHYGEGDEEDGYISFTEQKKYPEVNAFLNSVSRLEDFMKEIFGEHSRVTVTHENGVVNFDIEEYEHD